MYDYRYCSCIALAVPHCTARVLQEVTVVVVIVVIVVRVVVTVFKKVYNPLLHALAEALHRYCRRSLLLLLLLRLLSLYLKRYTTPYYMYWQKHCTGIAGGHCQVIEVGKSGLQIDFTFFFSTLFPLSHLSPGPSIICF